MTTDKKTVCPLCKSANLDFIADKVRFEKKADVYYCRECTLTFLDRESFAFPDAFYQKEYHQTYLTHVEPASLDPRAYYEKMKKASGIWAEKFRGMLTGVEQVLDVGCSTGHFLDLIKDKAGRVCGYDLNRKEVEFCREALHLDVSDQPIEERYEPETFDYITLIFVLEHIAAPAGFLKGLGRFLKPEGKLVILVPNIQDPLVNFYDIPEFRNFYYCIEHLFYFNPATLMRFIKQADFEGEIEVIQEYPITNHLNWIYRRRPADTLAARSNAPDICLRSVVSKKEWDDFWRSCDLRYKRFLGEHGYGDRIWAIAQKT